MTILTLDQIRAAAPSVFAARPWDGTRPDTYRFVPTHEVLELMQDQGFRVTRATQSHSRIEGKRPFARHLLRLRHADFLGATASQEVPEIVLVNSHDRSSAYRLFTGVFRVVCGNGLVVQAADFGSFAIRHSGRRDLFAQIKDATARITDGIPELMRQIDGWKGIDLDRPHQLASPPRHGGSGRRRRSSRLPCSAARRAEEPRGRAGPATCGRPARSSRST